ncbi:hypothetical protein [Bacillus sp. Bva_UNVM-123]|uniref:hypothetical protein n=1 Tax=Bacillus sp. Bva_UNVM-123 TaxID=2829798 RepID=UPI00391EFCE6
MINKQSQTLRKLTLTSGHMKELATEYDQLNIRGSVAIHKDVSLLIISSHGHSTFHSHVKANRLNASGSCLMKGHCEVKEIRSAGNLKMRSGQAQNIISSGKLTIEETLQAEHIEINGVIHAKKLHAKHLQLKLAGESKIEKLYTDEVHIGKDRKTISFLKKKLICHSIKGKRLELSYTNAEIVEGDVIIIGNDCVIQTLYYKEDYTISPNAKVQKIIRCEVK